MSLPSSSHLDDETLSGAIDGVVDEAGTVHLSACAECTRRRDELSRARAALAGASVEPLDELTRRRLVAAAVAARGTPARSRPWYARPALAGAAAAAVLVVLVAVPMLSGRDDANLAATAESDLATGTYLGDLGDLSDPALLRQRLLGLAAGEEAATMAAEAPEAHLAEDSSGGASAGMPVPGAAPAPAAPVPDAFRDVPAGAVSSPPAAPEALDATSGPVERRDGAEKSAVLDRAVTEQCTTALAGGPARGATLVAVAGGTYEGTPAVVAAFAADDGTSTAYIAARDDCRLLTSHRLR